MNIFKVGGFYRHASGKLMHIIGKSSTESIMYKSPMLFSEDPSGNIQPIDGESPGSDVGWSVSTKEEFETQRVWGS